MNFLNYSLISLLSFFGLIVGIILVKIAPEEQKPGMRNFVLMQNIVFILTVFFLMFYLKVNIFLFLLNILTIFYLLRIKVKNNFKKSMIMYGTLGVIFFFSLENNNLFLIQTILVFLFGMATGSLLFKNKNYSEIVLKNSIFLIIALALPFLFSYF